MKKIKISTKPFEIGIENYFSKPAPILSDNNVKMVCDEIDLSYDYFVEYGMGSSTLYFIESFENLDISIISIETDYSWFKRVIKFLKKKNNIYNISENEHAFTLSQIISFINDLRKPSLNIPSYLSRRSRWKTILLYGKFMKFHPEPKKKYSFNPFFWNMFKSLFLLLNFSLYVFRSKMRPRYGELNCKYNEMKIILKNIPPSLKDQFGESPMMEDYINAGLNEIERELKSNKTVKAAFFIDGGPRGNIIDAIFQLEDLYKSFYPTVILCEAHRKFYSSTLKKRSNGRFVKGSNITINHQQVYD